VDTDVDPEVAVLLRKVGFAAKSAHHIKCVNDDTLLLRWARKHNYILVCHDKHRDTKTRHSFYTEMYRSGGHVIRVTQPPSQSALLTLGKILVHRPSWQGHFQEDSGEFVAPASQAGKFISAAALYERIALQRQLPFAPDVAMTRRHPLRSRPRSKRPRSPTEATLI
jgi:hypothetical protein